MATSRENSEATDEAVNIFSSVAAFGFQCFCANGAQQTANGGLRNRTLADDLGAWGESPTSTFSNFANG
jgi:hypothetical protein